MESIASRMTHTSYSLISRSIRDLREVCRHAGPCSFRGTMSAYRARPVGFQYRSRSTDHLPFPNRLLCLPGKAFWAHRVRLPCTFTCVGCFDSSSGRQDSPIIRQVGQSCKPNGSAGVSLKLVRFDRPGRTTTLIWVSMSVDILSSSHRSAGQVAFDEGF